MVPNPKSNRDALLRNSRFLIVSLSSGALLLVTGWLAYAHILHGNLQYFFFPLVIFLCVSSIVTWKQANSLEHQIAEINRVSGALRESETRFSALVNGVRDYAIFMLDPEGHIVSWNEGAKRIKGYESAEVIGKHINMFYSERDREQNESSRNLALALKYGHHESEGLRIKKDGSTFWANVVLTPIYNNDKLLGFAKITRDITERKKNEEQIRYLATLMEDMSDAVFSFDSNFVIRAWNNGAELLFGYSHDEVVGRLAAEVLRARLPDGERLQARELLKTTGHWKGEVNYTHRNGNVIAVFISFSSIRSTTEADAGFVAVCRDITEQKTAQQQIAYMANLVTTSNDAIISLDSKSVVKSWNRGAEELYGFTEQEAVGQRMVDLIRATPTFEEVTAIREELFSKNSWKGESWHMHKDGTPICCLVSMSTIRDVENEVTGIVFTARDITARIKLEQQLKEFNRELEKQVKEKTAQLTQVFERVSDAFIAVDNEGKLTYANSKAAALRGTTPERVLGKDVWSIFPDEEDSSLRLNFAAARKHQQNVHFEAYSSSLKRWTENFIYPDPEGISYFFRDITAKKEAESALRHSEETRRLIMDAALDAIVCVDMKGFITVWNTQAEAIFGWSASEVMYKKLTQIILPQSSHDIDLFATGTDSQFNDLHAMPRSVELPAMHKNGHEFPAEISIALIRQGNEEFFCAYIRDITERKVAEQEIRQSEKKYKLLFKNNPMPMWMVELHNGQVLDVNDAAVSHYGYTREEFLGMDTNLLRPEEDRIRFREELQAPIPGISARGIWNHIKKDGTIIHAEINAYDFEYEHKNVRLVLANDITDKLRAEENLRNSYNEIRHLASHLQMVREEERAGIAREIHDELGQQLTGLKMDMSLISKRLAANTVQGLPEKVRSSLELLDHTIKTMRRISTDLHPSILDDLGVLAAMEWQISEFQRRSGIFTKCNLNADEHLFSPQMRIGLFRIVQESLTNAARHANASEIEVQLQEHLPEIVLTIQDNGKGFDTTNRTQKKSLGLLSIKERTLMMGGRFELNSAPGKGTQLRVVVPVSNKAV